MPGKAYLRVYAIAEEQLGYFTTAQARLAGVRTPTVVMMEKRGIVDRVSHGVYCLVHYPASPLGYYMEATLWPYGSRGILARESALSLFGMWPQNPNRVQIYVPSTFRVRRETPATLHLIHQDVPEAHTTRMAHGILSTTPQRALEDLIRSGTPDGRILEAIQSGEEQGWLNFAEVEALQDSLSARTRA